MENINQLYERPSNGTIYAPFGIKIDAMKQLLLINFEKDPDDVYIGLEPQAFCDEHNGCGFRIVAWRSDGYVDVYQQPGLKVPENKFDVAGKGLADLVIRPLKDMHYEITEAGVDIHFAFEDKLGRSIEVTIKESGKKPARPFSLLAPVASGSADPSALYMFFLYKFYFVRKAGTLIDIIIDGKRHIPDMLPLPLNGETCYFSRYSADPFLVSITAPNGMPVSVKPQEGGADANGIRYDITDNGGNYEIARMSCGSGKHDVNINFSPAIPDIASLNDNASIEGKFRISSEESAGEVGGVYKVNNNGGNIEIYMHPSEGWKPNEKNLVLRLIYKVAAVFKTWPKTYEYRAYIDLTAETPVIQSAWKRI